MIVSYQESFDWWIAIMKKCDQDDFLDQVENARKKGRQTSPITFYCLMGLKDVEVVGLQKKINEEGQLFLRNKWDKEDVIDMETRAKQIKQDRLLKEDLNSLKCVN